MKIIGDKPFVRDADGRLLSRIGTLFLHTPGLVTKGRVHAQQRVMWIESIKAQRAKKGLGALSFLEEEKEMSESVDLIFTEDFVLIRPNPDRMDLAVRADEELQKMVSKRQIRYLNTNSAKVREALRRRGENWRMARQPVSSEDITHLLVSSRTAIDGSPVYYYNHTTGTRYLTVTTYDEACQLPAEEFRSQIVEIVTGLGKFNRVGRPEIDLFPKTTSIELKRRLQALKPAELDDEALRKACRQIALDWRMSLPENLRDESAGNFEWRNEMCHTLTHGPNDTSTEEQELISGISPEFYRQIEWLPGARIEDGEVIFDNLYTEAEKNANDKGLHSLCDSRVKAIILNTTRLFSKIAYINVGRIAHSLARRHNPDARRGYAYIMQVCEEGETVPKVQIIRMQQWGVAEHLDEGKDMLQAISETNENYDYVLDRRRMCLQLGMNLPSSVGYGQIFERYHGNNKYNGFAIWSGYFVRSYVPGIASDKVPLAKYRNPAWSGRFAELMGEQAALDMIVGRRSEVDKGLLFDFYYEVIQQGEDGLPKSLVVTDHAGSFTDYTRSFEKYVDEYAAFIERRKAYVGDVRRFAKAYVDGFHRKLAETKAAYRLRPRAFESLFNDRPYDRNGSGAYRWRKVLKRLDNCEPATIAKLLSQAIDRILKPTK